MAKKKKSKKKKSKSRKRRRKNRPLISKKLMRSLGALVCWALAVLILIAFVGQGALIGRLHQFLIRYFGFSLVILPFVLLVAGAMIEDFSWRLAKPGVFWGSLLLLVGFMGLFSTGSLGSGLTLQLNQLVGTLGAIVLFSTIALAGFIIMTEIALAQLVGFFGGWLGKVFKGGSSGLGAGRQLKIQGINQNQSSDDDSNKSTDSDILVPADPNTKQVSKPMPASPEVEEETMAELGKAVITSDPKSQSVWTPPPLSILSKKGGGTAERGDLKKNASIIEDLLDSFGISGAKVAEVNCGPAVTQYALEITMGTKLSKITGLQNDLALALAAPTGQIRIEAPIPGRSLVGIEIPNQSPEFVTMRKILLSDQMKQSRSKLTVGLGLDVSGKPVVADISSMPHVLIAGATGSGKSVCINTFLASILFRASPDEVKFILVDPKRVELTGYNDIPHLLTPVIVEPQKAGAALKWAVKEMQDRYKLFAEAGVRNIEGFNEMSGFSAVPYIVIVIDELADIMLFSPKEVEESIIKLAQMARAVGIHLVLATQRPSVDVLTGLIKANVPTRIAFNVASMVDSRVILDSAGAEKLLGRGDMLFIPPSASKPSRIQGTFVSDEEINGLIDYLKNSGVEPQYTADVTAKFSPPKITGAGGQTIDDVDELFPDAVKLVVENNKASASMLQRYLSVGFNRASRILDQLEEAGVVSPSDGSSKPRKVLITSADAFLNPGSQN